ncbi:hypothetical protein [Pseudomonas putida]|uniref:hypothetical protein n=1 Tax=Pseudomonas putida TaxID=303 RepID=UPI00300EC94D
MKQNNNTTQKLIDKKPDDDKDVAAAKRLSTLLEPVVKLAGLFSGGGVIFSAIVSIAVLMIYAKAIGRNDLVPLVLDNKLTALLPWVGTTFLFFGSYCLIIFFASAPYIMGMQFFKETPATRPRVATLFALSAIAGSIVFIVLTYKFSDVSLSEKSIWVFGVTSICLLATLFDKQVRWALQFLSLDTAPQYNAAWWHRAGIFLFSAFPVAASVFCAVYPTSLLLFTYIGDDTPESVNYMAFLSAVSVVFAYLPAWAFFTTKHNLVTRILTTTGIALSAATTIIIMAPGAGSNIVYSSAGAMGVRDSTVANYRLKKDFVLGDFDAKIWGTVAGKDAEPVISAFTLFSLGDILLLCPAKMAPLKLKDWVGSNAQACVITHSSEVVRLSHIAVGEGA